jgi:hypothetical protein
VVETEQYFVDKNERTEEIYQQNAFQEEVSSADKAIAGRVIKEKLLTRLKCS